MKFADVILGQEVSWRGRSYRVLALLPHAAQLKPMNSPQTYSLLYVRYRALKPVEKQNA